MAINRNFTNFRAIYDELTDEVGKSREQFLPDHLENWFDVIEETPSVREIVGGLMKAAFLDQLTLIGDIKKPGIENKKRPWPIGRDKRLGVQLCVFKEIAARTLLARVFGARFIEGTQPEEAADQVVKHVFLPMARDLRRRLESEPEEQEEPMAPASDRNVTLDHNSEPYKDVMDALDRLEKAIVEANDYPDTEDKDQRIAEVSAAKRLLLAVRVRVGALVHLAKPLVVTLAKKFVETEIGKAASWAAEKLSMLLGSMWDKL
jgi:hypothetical protein